MEGLTSFKQLSFKKHKSVINQPYIYIYIYIYIYMWGGVIKNKMIQKRGQ